MISLNEAVQSGERCLRLPRWAYPEDHIKIDIIEGRLGPWAHLYSPGNEIIGQDNPQPVLTIGWNLDDAVWEVWKNTEGGEDETT